MNAPLLSALGEWPSFLRTVDHHRHRVCSDRNQDTKRSALLTLFSACCLFLFLSLGAAAQTTILSEGFEGNFPADNGWSVVDSNASGTTAYWDDVNSAFGGEGTHTGNYKG